MSKIVYSLLILIQAIIQALADDLCFYTPTWSTGKLSKWCAWGCCYDYLNDPCCDRPYYAGTPFIVGMVIGSIAFVICIAVLIVVRRRRYRSPVVTYAAPGNQQVFSSTVATSNTVNTGFANPGFGNQGGYRY